MLGGALLLAGSAARGDDAGDRARARAAYDRGVAAQGRGDYAAAAREFAAADAIVPSPAALGAALEAATSADDAVLGAELCDRAAARAPDGKVPAERRDGCDAARRRTGKILVACASPNPNPNPNTTTTTTTNPNPNASTACDATIDGVAVTAGRPTVVMIGTHTIGGNSGAQAWKKSVSVAAGQTVRVDAAGEGIAAAGNPGSPAAGAGTSPETPSKYVISPLWTLAAGALTGAVGGFTIGSAVDTKNKHDAFVALGCAGPVHGDCSARAQHGAFAQDRTNVLVGTTIGLAAVTAGLGAVTLFSRRSAASGGVAVAATPGGALVRVTFE